MKLFYQKVVYISGGYASCILSLLFPRIMNRRCKLMLRCMRHCKFCAAVCGGVFDFVTTENFWKIIFCMQL